MKKVFGIGAVAVVFAALCMLCRKKESKSADTARYFSTAADLSKKYAEREE